jgi:hypothetical protein
VSGREAGRRAGEKAAEMLRRACEAANESIRQFAAALQSYDLEAEALAEGAEAVSRYRFRLGHDGCRSEAGGQGYRPGPRGWPGDRN